MPLARADRRPARGTRSIAIAVLLATWLAAATHAAAQPDDPLAALRWQRRIVLVFAPTVDDARLQRQQALIAALGPAAQERDLLQMVVVAGSTIGGPQALDPNVLRRRYAVGAADFRVLLLGKDGGVKLRSETAVDGCALIALIEAMPMRQRERLDPSEVPAGCVSAQ